MQMLEGGSPDRTENLTAGNLDAANATVDQHRDTASPSIKSAITAAAKARMREVKSKLSAAIARAIRRKGIVVDSESKSDAPLHCFNFRTPSIATWSL